ncbi:uncharacterized protein G2W53_007959 [Senna tora]|uniref:Uncharacterized protein n=1 Tax=Senna tora TaxID=362788 RepID=A0A835CHQ6_9FABA|nr:uncharacterized protein G2W53_007959 [Senna tora]
MATVSIVWPTESLSERHNGERQ